MSEATYLERTLYRLRAQYATLGEALAGLSATPGKVWEIGLGKGRSYDHLRRALPQAEIFAFDRQRVSVPDCTPPDHRMVLGALDKTLPELAAAHAGQVVLAHVDLGIDPPGEETRAALERWLPVALAPGGLVAAGTLLDLAGARRLAAPEAAAAGGYALYVLHGHG
jgi:trans-aconitate methyltransferase